ncbi:hypothetical protein AtEden1_Chr2g0231531 [Arabidopsis thaliana]
MNRLSLIAKPLNMFSPWLFNNWFVVNQRWEIFLAIDFLTTIELWVQIRGIPMPYVCVETVSDIAHDLGHIIHIDFHQATTNQIAYIRVRVRFGINDRLRFFQRISHCLRFTHQRNPSPYSLPLLAPRHEDRVQISAERVRRVLHDELCRSDMNSQSQLSDDSFPAPLTPPLTVPTPPLNLVELAATRLELFPPTTVTSSQKLMVHRPQVGIQAQQRRPNSQVSPLTEEEDTSRFSRIVETGESSRRVEMGESSRQAEEEASKRKTTQDGQKESDKRSQKQKVSELKEGGILKPPKKR